MRVGDVGLAAGLGVHALDDRDVEEIGVVAVLHRRLAFGAGDEVDELAGGIHVLRLGADAETLRQRDRTFLRINRDDRLAGGDLGEDGAVLVDADRGVAGQHGLVDLAAARQAGQRLVGQRLAQQRLARIDAVGLEEAGEPLIGRAGQVRILGGDAAGEDLEIGPGLGHLVGRHFLGVDLDCGRAGAGGQEGTALRDQRFAEIREGDLVVGLGRDRLQHMVGRHALHDGGAVEPDDVELRVAALGGDLAQRLAGAAGLDDIDGQSGLGLEGLGDRTGEVQRVVEHEVSGRGRRRDGQSGQA